MADGFLSRLGSIPPEVLMAMSAGFLSDNPAGGLMGAAQMMGQSRADAEAKAQKEAARRALLGMSGNLPGNIGQMLPYMDVNDAVKLMVGWQDTNTDNLREQGYTDAQIDNIKNTMWNRDRSTSSGMSVDDAQKANLYNTIEDRNRRFTYETTPPELPASVASAMNGPPPPAPVSREIKPGDGSMLLDPAKAGAAPPPYSATDAAKASAYWQHYLGKPKEGMMYSPDGKLVSVPGFDASFDNQAKLRGEYLKQTDEFVTIGNAFANVQAAASNPSAAGDLSLIFAYMKMLDPNSVVRETEFANAQNAAGVPDQVRNMWNRALTGERLNENQRADFVKQADNLYKNSQQRAASVGRTYRGLAEDYGMDPSRVVVDRASPAAAGGHASPDDDLLRKYGIK